MRARKDSTNCCRYFTCFFAMPKRGSEKERESVVKLSNREFNSNWRISQSASLEAAWGVSTMNHRKKCVC